MPLFAHRVFISVAMRLFEASISILYAPLCLSPPRCLTLPMVSHNTPIFSTLSQQPDVVPALVVEFDHLISKAKLEEGDNFADHLNKVRNAVSSSNQPFLSVSIANSTILPLSIRTVQVTRTEATAIVDPCFRTVAKGTIVQLERIGFFRVDEAYNAATNKPVVLFKIPDGKAKPLNAK